MSTEIKKPSGGWSSIRRQLNAWSKPAFIALVKELYDHAADNRDFLEARFQAEDSGGAALEKYRRKIIDQFFPRYGNESASSGWGRRARPSATIARRPATWRARWS